MPNVCAFPTRRPALTSPPRSIRHGGWALAAAVGLLFHLILSLWFSDRQWVTPLGAGSVCLVGLALSLYRARYGSEVLRFRWCLLASGFVLWLAAYAAIAQALAIGADSSRALPFILIFALRGIPWFMAMVRTSDRWVLPHSRWFDRAQAALLAASATFLFFPHLLAGTAVSLPYVSSELAGTYHDVQNGLLASLSIGGIFLQPTRQERAFAVHLCLMLVSYAVISYGVNHAVIEPYDPAPGSPIFLLIDLPVALFIIASALTPHTLGEADLLPRTPLHRILLLLAPALLTGGALLMGFVIAQHRPLVGMGIGMTALALYAFRSALTQAAHARTQVALRKAHARMETLAQLDALTNLPNRRTFDAALPRAWDAALQDGKGLSLLFLDVDNFKAYNDRFGHAAGDLCLRRVADALQRHAQREGDLVARYGGEEFVVLLPHTDGAAAIAIAERMREEVTAESMPHPIEPTGVVTVSIGLAHAVPSRSATSERDLLERADRALYRAKAQGRNQIASGEVPRLASRVGARSTRRDDY